MLSRFKQHLQCNFSYLENAKILVAISGGMDSIVLSSLLHKLNHKIGLAHVNYNLRGEESNKDENFVKNFGEKHNIPLYANSVDTNLYAKKKGISIQMAAREIRYQWFDEVTLKHDYDFVLTAHHLDDSIETFFINLNRSSGLEGLLGIPEKNNIVVRPLLIFSRAEIEEYAIQNKLDWREDASNATTKYERNKIRHELVPVLKDINPKFSASFIKTQLYLQGSHSLVKDYISLLKSMFWEEKNERVSISLKELSDLPNLKTILFELLKDYGFTEWEDVYQLVKGQTGKQVFSNTHSLLKDRGCLLLNPIEIANHADEKIEIGNKFKMLPSSGFGIEYSIGEFSDIKSFQISNSNEIFFDKTKVNFPLFVRKWKKGDYFYPFGMDGRKKLSDFLIDEKISRLEKEKIWLLCDFDDKIIWIIGKRLDNRFRITENTTKIIHLKTKFTT